MPVGGGKFRVLLGCHLFFFFFLADAAYGILVPPPGIEPESWPVRAQSPDH